MQLTGALGLLQTIPPAPNDNPPPAPLTAFLTAFLTGPPGTACQGQEDF